MISGLFILIGAAAIARFAWLDHKRFQKELDRRRRLEDAIASYFPRD